jgi:hypothetical protein
MESMNITEVKLGSPAGSNPGFVVPEACYILGALFRNKSTKSGTKVYTYLELQNKCKNTNFKKLTCTTNITKSSKIT